MRANATIASALRKRRSCFITPSGRGHISLVTAAPTIVRVCPKDEYVPV